MATRDVKRARNMRKTMSPPELALWFRLRALRDRGWHFRRQSPEPPYFLDFVCRKQKLIIEVDGIHHSDAKQANHDDERDQELTRRGYSILRFWATDVRDELDAVMDAIVNALGSPGAERSHTEPNLARDRSRPRFRHITRLGLRLRPIE